MTGMGAVDTQFLKALRLLDRGEWARAEAALNLSIAQATADGRLAAAVPALVCLGELLVREGREEEGRRLLELAVQQGVGDLDDAFDVERATAQALLRECGPSGAE